MAFKRYTICIDDETYEIMKTMSVKTGDSLAEITRTLIRKGLASEWINENTDLIARLIRQQMEVVIKPHIERLAKLSSKSGHMSATAAFLNVQALMDLVPKERRKDVVRMYESARKKSVEYMRTKTDDWKGLED